MKVKSSVLVSALVAVVLVTSLLPQAAYGLATDAQPAIAKRIGTIKTLNGNTLTLAPASGPEVAVTLQPAARILRLAPGDKDLKNATPLQAQDLHVGDTIRVRGSGSADGNSISALEVIVITQAAVAAVSDQTRQDWQKRGMGGLVESVDSTNGTVTVTGPAGKVVLRTTKKTLVYRYSPDSAKAEDAKPSSLAEIHPHEQLNARGNKNADGTEITAEEIYAGPFPLFPATVKSVDINSGMLTVQDLTTKRTVEVKITADSLLQKIPAQIAQMYAMRLKGLMPPGTPAAANISQAGAKPAGPGNGQAPSPAGSTWSGGGSMGGGMRSNGPPDIQRMLSRVPASTLADLNLQKGDALMILSTEGSATSPQRAIRLLSGVEPILEAAPSASSAMMLTPWNLGGGAPGGDASQ